MNWPTSVSILPFSCQLLPHLRRTLLFRSKSVSSGSFLLIQVCVYRNLPWLQFSGSLASDIPSFFRPLSSFQKRARCTSDHISSCFFLFRPFRRSFWLKIRPITKPTPRPPSIPCKSGIIQPQVSGIRVAGGTERTA